MAEEDVLDVDDQEGVEGADGERERSSIPVPYADIDNAVRIAKGVYQFGTSSQIDQLAAQLNVKVKGGGFRQMLGAAKIFGLVTFGQGTVQLTVLGQRINDPKQEKAAKAEAFLAAALYRSIYDRVKAAGGTLPPPTGLENEMIGLGVAKKVADRARQTFQRSAQQAGFFSFGQDRLIMPKIDQESGKPDPEKGRERGAPGKDGGDGSGGGPTRDPLLQGLINKLPTDGAVWPAEDRLAWMELAKGIFDFVYGKADAIKVELVKKSAE